VGHFLGFHAEAPLKQDGSPPRGTIIEHFLGFHAEAPLKPLILAITVT
jgi:hypothetical protein